MGKSTVSCFLQDSGVPVLSADAVVHQLYAAGGAAVQPVAAAFPSAVVDGAVDRARLSACVVGNEAAMQQLEGIVHPLVEAERLKFVQQVGWAAWVPPPDVCKHLALHHMNVLPHGFGRDQGLTLIKCATSAASLSKHSRLIVLLETAVPGDSEPDTAGSRLPGCLPGASLACCHGTWHHWRSKGVTCAWAPPPDRCWQLLSHCCKQT